MKIAVVRGQYLTKWEMQNFEPLTEHAEVTAFGSRLAPFALDTLRMPVERLLCVDPYINRSRVLRGSLGYALGRYVGRQYLLGLESALAGFDVVHAAETFNGFTYQAVQAAHGHHRRKLRLVTSCYETIPFLHEEERPMRRQKRYVQQHADVFLAMSPRAADTLRLEGVDARRIRMHFPGIDLRHFHPMPRVANDGFDLWTSQDSLRVLLVGSITPEKGITQFILAANEISKQAAFNGRVEFALVGNGDDALIRRMIATLRLENVVRHRTGIPYADMPRLYASADLFVLPSLPAPHWEEQFGMVLAESMACGKAIVSTTSGAIPDVVGDAGMLVPPYNYRALAERIAHLLRDESERAILGERAALRARELFDAEVFAADMYRLYTELVD